MEEDKEKIFSAKNIVKGPISSIAGFVLIVAGIYTVVTGLEWMDAIFPIGLGSLLMVAPDEIIAIIKNKLEK